MVLSPAPPPLPRKTKSPFFVWGLPFPFSLPFSPLSQFSQLSLTLRASEFAICSFNDVAPVVDAFLLPFLQLGLFDVLFSAFLWEGFCGFCAALAADPL